MISDTLSVSEDISGEIERDLDIVHRNLIYNRTKIFS